MKELDPLSRALLSAAAGCHEPLAADRARIRRRLIARLGVAAGLGALGSAATQTSPAMAAMSGGAVAESSLTATLLGSAKLLALGKVVGLTVAASAAGFGGYEWLASRADTGAQPTVAASAARAARARPFVTRGPTAAIAATTADSTATTSAATAESQAPERTEPQAPPSAGRAVVARAPTIDQPLRQPSQAESAPPLPPVASFPSEVPNLAAEARGLARAQAALTEGNAAQALTLLDQQKAQFPDGALDEERAAARVLALCRMGQVQAAGAAAAEFLRRSPRSVLAERVANACPHQK
jgi:hypothetical protein